ncbi:acetoacetate decarboxylase family protein [Neptunicella marina]|uniref:Acetoacetate decarboxylase family protein n=1 Tax=Neptunicella marina TaxID=2125989 RepID=A0A8J6IS94_9ALTE|nr:acetoacetate decarboxylase family protein [Neptunicella marina]MBC3765344.1 acetoacetate decarboxylase family protein [Neptunicella marina]
MFGLPKRIKRTQGKYALVDGIPFKMPVDAVESPAFMAVFPIDAEQAATFLPRNVHPLRLWKKALLVVTVIDYRHTTIGKYVEYSIAIACTHGNKPAPPLLPALLPDVFNMGQYVLDLPVSSEISVKGGKGIWGMPKHQAQLNFNISEDKVSSQYDLDGQLVAYVEIDKPAKARLPVKMKASNYCSFRGMLMKSDIFLDNKAGINLFSKARARFVIGEHPRLQTLKQLNIGAPLATVFLPAIHGTLDDRIESWFLDFDELPKQTPEGMESVVNLGLGESWLPPPTAPVPAEDEQ